MHYCTMQTRKQTKAEYKASRDNWQMAENIKNHMTYICAFVLYDKMGMTWKKLDNCYVKLYHLTERWYDEADEDVTSEKLLGYSKKKGLDVYQFVLTIPRSDKLALGDMKKGIIRAAGTADSQILASLLMLIPILKETYRYSNDKINEFLEWVKYAICMYNTKLPKEKGMVLSDEYIRQIFIEDEGFDMRKGDK